MESFTTLNDLYLRSAARDLAHSALPNAPVLASREPRRRIGRLYSAIRHPVGQQLRRPVVGMRPARYSHES
jgi:hypothetical protein